MPAHRENIYRRMLFQLFEHLKSCRNAATKQDLIEMEKRFMASQTNLAKALNDLTAQLGKANDEIQGKITDLESKLTNEDVSPELQAAFDTLKTATQKLDDIVPDAPPASTAPATGSNS